MKRPIIELLEELNTTDEHLRLEAKAGLGDSALETISAFSNEPGLDGGYLVFGVEKEEEGRYRIVGVPDPDGLAQRLASWCSDETFNRPVRPTIWTDVIDGKPVVAAFVPEARPGDKPIYLRRRGLPKGAYRRIGTGDVRCSEDDLRYLHQLASDVPYEDTLVDDATMDDLDLEVIASYRRALVERNPATEVRDLEPAELVRALGCARVDDKGVLKPTVAGVLLFGKALALRRLFPMHRVDYIRVPGNEWMEDAECSYDSIDVRQPLLVAFRRIYQAVLDDLPKTVEIRAGSPERIESPPVPARVIREALVNALCHRDYRVHSPTQVIRYSSRIELRNAGHSLIDEDRLGEPGSQSRNPRIADVFRDMGIAENKGSGIRVMRREMEKAQLARPLFESDRGANRFVAKLLFTHLFTDEQRAWLTSLGEPSLSPEQQLALVCCRETGEVRNATLRDLAGLETLAASRVLQGLRDRGLLELRGAGPSTHYVLTSPTSPVESPDSQTSTSQEVPVGAVEEGGESQTARPPEQLSLPTTEVPARTQGFPDETQGFPDETQGFSGETQGFSGETQGFPGETQGMTRVQLLELLPRGLRDDIERLGKRPTTSRLRDVIEKLCADRPFSPSQLALLLERKDVNHLVRSTLTPMVQEGRLELLYPETPSHPRQAYRTVARPPSGS